MRARCSSSWTFPSTSRILRSRRPSSSPSASDPGAAERELLPAIELFETSGATHIAASLIPLLACARVQQGRVDEALELSERTEEISAPDDLDAQVRWRIARAQALSAANELAEAERFAREAVAVAESGRHGDSQCRRAQLRWARSSWRPARRRRRCRCWSAPSRSTTAKGDVVSPPAPRHLDASLVSGTR